MITNGNEHDVFASSEPRRKDPLLINSIGSLAIFGARHLMKLIGAVGEVH